VFQRIADPKVDSPFESVFDDCLQGMAETHAAAVKKGQLDYQTMRISGLEVIDRYRFRLKLTKQYPQILFWFAYQCTSPVAREAVEFYDGKDGREDFHKFASVGTSAYRIVSYVPRSRVILERVPNYTTSVFPTDGFPPEKAEWLKQFAGKPLPFIDEIQLDVQPENIPRFVLFRQGYLDVMGVDKDSFNAMVTPMRSLSPEFQQKGTILEPAFEIDTFWTAFNMDDPVVGKNLKLRQAIAYAADSKRYCEIFYAGVAPVATQLLPAGIFGYEKNRPPRYPFDLAKAKQMLAEAGYPNGRDASGKQLVLKVTAAGASSDERQRAEFEQRCIQQLGIEVNVDIVTFAKQQDLEDRGDYQIMLGSGWGADYPDPEDFFMLLYSKNVSPVGKNYFRFRNAKFDAIYEKMVIAENGPERKEMIRQLNEIIDEECPLYPTFNKAQYLILQPWAPRTQTNLMYEVDGGHKYLVTDPVLRARMQKEWNRPAVWPAFVLGAFALTGIGLFIRAFRRTRQQNA
jgi:oligopeptide transport system substrate-binding protein